VGLRPSRIENVPGTLILNDPWGCTLYFELLVCLCYPTASDSMARKSKRTVRTAAPRKERRACISGSKCWNKNCTFWHPEGRDIDRAAVRHHYSGEDARSILIFVVGFVMVLMFKVESAPLMWWIAVTHLFHDLPGNRWVQGVVHRYRNALHDLFSTLN